MPARQSSSPAAVPFSPSSRSTYLVRTGAELRAAEQAFADCKPFRVGMSPDEVEFAARDAINRYKRLPAFNATDALALHKMLLEKLPDNIATRREEAIKQAARASD
jgi:hypothetical protein